MAQPEFNWDVVSQEVAEDNRRSVLELWSVDEIYEGATGELLQRLYEDMRIERKAAGIKPDFLATYVSMWANNDPDGGLMAIGVEDKTGNLLGCSAKAQQLVEAEGLIRRDLVPDARLETKRV